MRVAARPATSSLRRRPQLRRLRRLVVLGRVLSMAPYAHRNASHLAVEPGSLSITGRIVAAHPAHGLATLRAASAPTSRAKHRQTKRDAQRSVQAAHSQALQEELLVLKRSLHHVGELVHVDNAVTVFVRLADDVLHIIVTHYLSQRRQRDPQLCRRDRAVAIAVNDSEDVVNQLARLVLCGGFLGRHPVEEFFELNCPGTVDVNFLHNELRNVDARIRDAHEL
mmetsp:Transcript_19577/g.69305  ORF Transcript_19577/g.69305 Transcript_19577/m.69305 type:complete len:224 (-) Transcript_19577:2619-3290(-)